MLRIYNLWRGTLKEEEKKFYPLLNETSIGLKLAEVFGKSQRAPNKKGQTRRHVYDFDLKKVTVCPTCKTRT